jgi:hypothetical protein
MRCRDSSMKLGALQPKPGSRESRPSRQAIVTGHCVPVARLTDPTVGTLVTPAVAPVVTHGEELSRGAWEWRWGQHASRVPAHIVGEVPR